MSKADWGVKRLCQSCGAKFYDMKKDPITCPSCGSVFDPETQRTKRARPAASGKTAKAAVSKSAAIKENDDEILDDDDLGDADLDEDLGDDSDAGDDDLLADTDDLEDEDDKIPGVRVSGDDDDT